MSKMKLLLDVVSDLRSLADSLQAVADAVAQGGQEQMDQTTEEKPVQKPEKRTTAKKEEPPTEKAGQQSKPLTLEQVRAALAEKSRAGHTAEALTISLIAQGMAVSKGETVTCGSVSFFAITEMIVVSV